MKIICIENAFAANPDEEIYFTLRPDSTLLRGNNDFYRPDFSQETVCGCGFLLRINRLAKFVEPRFAMRCTDAVGAAVSFVAEDVMRDALAKGRPCEQAYSFDRSLAVTDWFEGKSLAPESGITLSVNGLQRQTISVADMRLSIEECISRASKLLTLRVGDVIYVGMPAEVRIALDDTLALAFEGYEMLDFRIK